MLQLAVFERTDDEDFFTPGACSDLRCLLGIDDDDESKAFLSSVIESFFLFSDDSLSSNPISAPERAPSRGRQKRMLEACNAVPKR